MFSLKQILNNAKEKISSLDAEILMAHVLGLDRLQMLMLRDPKITDLQLQEFLALVERRVSHEPIAYILGHKEFWGLEFKVTNATLIPRPDSETLIEAVLENYKDKSTDYKILDLGTGTGCLAITLLHEYKNAYATLVDISPAALEIAKYNAKSIGVVERSSFVCSNWFEGVEGKFDIIVCNPPYIGKQEKLMKDVIDFEPQSALFADDMGMKEYKAIISQAKEFMNNDAMIFFEVGASQASDVSSELLSHGYALVGIKQDLARIERVVIAVTSQ